MAQRGRTGLLIATIVTLSVLACSLSGCFSQGDPSPKYSVSGRVVYADRPEEGVPGVTLHFSGHSEIAATGYDGSWEMRGLKGKVIVTPVLDGWEFEPPTREVSSAAANVNFKAAKVGSDILVPKDYPSIQSAIDATDDGDVIVVAPGVYSENINFNGKAITVRSTNPDDPAVVEATVIDGGARGPVVTFTSRETTNAVLMGFTITNGLGKDSRNRGGGIHIDDSSPTIKCNVIRGNISLSNGGGICVWQGDPLVVGNMIADNQAYDAGGGVHAVFSSLALVGNTIENNEAGCGGGVGLDKLTGTITNNTITANRAKSGAGLWIIRERDHQHVVRDNYIAGNLTTGDWGRGGGVYLWSTGANLEFTGNTIIQNTACYGGGLDITGCTGTVIDQNVIARNQATHGGGVQIYHCAQVIMFGNEVEENVAINGGGGAVLVRNSRLGLIEIADNRFTGNETNTDGGSAIDVGAECAPQVVGNQLVRNIAADSGAAIYVHYGGQVLDDQGNPLSIPDACNTYEGNMPQDLYYE